MEIMLINMLMLHENHIHLRTSIDIDVQLFVQSEENHPPQPRHQNGIKDNIPPNSQSQDVLSSTGQNIATISNIDIDLQPQDHGDGLRKAKPPRPATSASKGAAREDGKKEDAAVPQPHLRKQASGVLTGKEEHSAKRTERPEAVKDSRAPSGNMSVEEDTMKLLQQAAAEDVKTSKQDSTEAKEDRKTEAERHLGDRQVRHTL